MGIEYRSGSICFGYLLSHRAQAEYEHLQNIPLADENTDNLLLKIDILIGSSYYWKFVTNEIRRGEIGSVALASKLGYILSGQYMNIVILRRCLLIVKQLLYHMCLML